MVKFNFLTNPSALYRGRGTVCESSLNHNCPFLKWTIISLISLIISPTKSRSRICISQYYCALYIRVWAKPINNCCYCSSFKNRLFFYTKGLSLILFLIYMHINQWWIEPQLNWQSGGAVCNASQAIEGKENMLNCSCVCPVNLSCKLLHQSPRELQWSKSSLKSVARSNKSPCNAQDEWMLYGLLNCPYFTSWTH